MLNYFIRVIKNNNLIPCLFRDSIGEITKLRYAIYFPPSNMNKVITINFR